MSILIAVRHGRSTANTAGVLAGRTPGVELDEVGIDQARTLGHRLAGVNLSLAVTSPVERCRQTVELAMAEAGATWRVEVDARVSESDYGLWAGCRLKDLIEDPLWKVVQSSPQEARFPQGEAMIEVRDRVVDAVLDWNSRLAETDVWLLASHGDPLAALVNWAVGADFKHVQRVGLDPSSATVIALSPDLQQPPRVLATNSLEGSLARWATPVAGALVGGAAGTQSD